MKASELPPNTYDVHIIGPTGATKTFKAHFVLGYVYTSADGEKDYMFFYDTEYVFVLESPSKKHYGRRYWSHASCLEPTQDNVDILDNYHLMLQGRRNAKKNRSTGR